MFFIRDGMKFPDMVHSLKPNPKSHIQEGWRIADFFSHHPEAMHMVGGGRNPAASLLRFCRRTGLCWLSKGAAAPAAASVGVRVGFGGLQAPLCRTLYLVSRAVWPLTRPLFRFPAQPPPSPQFTFLMDDWGVPRDYRHMEGFGVHTFVLVNGAGRESLVKFHWKPTCGEGCWAQGAACRLCLYRRAGGGIWVEGAVDPAVRQGACSLGHPWRCAKHAALADQCTGRREC